MTIAIGITANRLDAQHVARLQQLVTELDAKIIWGRHEVACARNQLVVKWQQERTEDWLLLLDPNVIPPRGIGDMTRHDQPLVSACVPWFRPKIQSVPLPAAFEHTDIGSYRTIKNPFGRSGLAACDLVLPFCLLIRRDAITIEQPFVDGLTMLDGVREPVDTVPLCAAVQPHVDFDQVCDHIQPVSLQAIHAGYTGMFLQLHAQRQQQLVVSA